MNVREIDARSWLLKYVKAKHNLPNTIKHLGLLNLSITLMKMRMLQRTGRLLFDLASSTEITCQKTKNYCSRCCCVKSAVTCKLWQVSHCPRQGGVNSGKHSWTLGGVQ